MSWKTSEFAGLNDRDAWKALEIVFVKCHEVQDAVHIHRSNNPGIVNCDACYRLCRDEPAPFQMSGKTVG
jgi:hypothetical protein